MKLYHFNPNSYGQAYFVMAKDELSALNYLKSHFKEKAKIENQDDDWYKEEYKIWKNKTIDNLPFYYSIEEFDEGQIISATMNIINVEMD